MKAQEFKNKLAEFYSLLFFDAVMRKSPLQFSYYSLYSEAQHEHRKSEEVSLDLQ